MRLKLYIIKPPAIKRIDIKIVEYDGKDYIDMLKQYHTEVRANKENMFYHPKANKSGDEQGMDSSIKDVAGVFSETRGIKNPTPQQLEYINRGVPFTSVL